jgi:hypothetical protein
MSEDRPIFSRCSLGKQRWFWVVYRSWVALFEGEEALATGYAATALEAEQAALAVVPDAENYGSGTAASYHRELCIQRRATKPPSKHAGAAAREFLYTDWCSDWDNEWISTPHLIVKKTRKLVFVEKDDYHPDPWDRETYALNRAELEAKGSVWSHSARNRFYTTPYEQRRQSWESPELAVLGLRAGASKEEVKAAYRRLARQHRPDCGGDPEKFKEVQAAYERAMAG